MKIRNIFNSFYQSPINHHLQSTSIDWPEPENLHTTLLPVKSLSIENIPESYRDWITDVTGRMQCPPDFVAVSAMVMTGAIIGTSCGIKPKQMDDWLVVPNLWGGLVGRPGVLKTPAVSEVMQIMNQLETKAKKSYEAAMSIYLADLEVYKSERDAIKGALFSAHKQGLKKKSIKNSFEPQSLKEQLLQQKEPQKPIWKRYKTNDTTIEKLSELLTDNPRGLLLYRDELVGLLSSWDKDGREMDRAFFLEAWNGDGSLTTDRIGRGTVHTENLCISIFGNTQPAKLSHYLYRAIRGMDNDGLLQRFQLLIYPDDTQDWQYVDRAPNYEAKQRVINLINKLATMNFVEYGAMKESGDRFPFYHFDDAAQDIFNEWLTMLEKNKLKQDDQPILLEHLSKYRSLMPSLALIFHLIDVADGKIADKISSDHVFSAINWCGYLESHARRIYGMINNTVHQAVAKLAQKIKSGELALRFTVRDVYRKEWSLLDDKATVQKACEELVDAGWIRKEMLSYEKGRPKSPTFIINPKLKIHNIIEENFF